MWDSTNGELLLTLTGDTAGLASVRYSPDGRFIATGGGQGYSTVRVWDARTGKQIYVLTGHQLWVFGLAFSPDNSLWPPRAEEEGLFRALAHGRRRPSDRNVGLKGSVAYGGRR